MLTVAEVAEQLNVGVQSIYVWHQTRQFPQATVDPTPGVRSKLVWAESDVAAWAQSTQGQAKLADYRLRSEARQRRALARKSTRRPQARRSTSLEASL